jgi:hypothetical protein
MSLLADCVDPHTGEIDPVVIVTDNGPAMKSVAVARWFKSRPEVTHVRTRHRSPHTNGVIERWFESLKYERLSEQVQSEMQTKVKSLSREKMRTSSLEGLRAASSSIALLSADEAEGVIGWIVDVGRATAEAASDRGEKAEVSDGEAGMLRTIEATLRGTG